VSGFQRCGFLLELSPDWLIQRASENAHRYLGQYHQRLIGEPLSQFTLAQPLHDLRNSLARQRGATGTARAFRVRLFDDPRHFDIAFQALDSSIILEGLPSADGAFGEWLGSVGRLIDGLRGHDRRHTLESAARRLRALTGFDRVTAIFGDDRIESSRGNIAQLQIDEPLPAIVADVSQETVSIFPEDGAEEPNPALLRAPSAAQIDAMRLAEMAAVLRVPCFREGKTLGRFECDNRLPVAPSFELYSAAELFAQVVGMTLD